jgi:hypothetical protein
MSILNVTSIDSLEALKNTMIQYREQSSAIVQGFASELSERIAYLESLESYFTERVRRAEEALRSCEISRSFDPPNHKRSCASQAAALASTQAKYNRYLAIMAQVRQAHLAYKESERKHTSSMHYVSSSSIPKFEAIIDDVKVYYRDIIN